MNRRNWLLGLSAAGVGLALAPALLYGKSTNKLRILVLGGTGFIGPHLVRHAISRGHDVTLFNRGRTNTDLFPDIRKLVGDRNGGLDALKTGHWDVVLDNSGYVPGQVHDSASLLKDRVGRYIFTSSISAYDASSSNYPFGAGSELVPWTNPASENVGQYYGEFKAQCERHVQNIYADKATVVRPTFIAGPGDRSQRFTWWVERIHRGGDVLAPGNPDTNFSIIDVRDLAEFYIQLMEDDRGGVFNASGPAGRFSFGGMLNGIRATTEKAVDLHWADAEFLETHNVSGREIPMWGFVEDGQTALVIENQSSIDAGLAFRPFYITTLDTLAWHRQRPAGQQDFTRAGIDPGKEAKVIAAWSRKKNMGG